MRVLTILGVIALAVAAVTGPSEAEAVEGVRNVRTVLKETFYRGGGPGGMRPLDHSALQSLCREGFTEAVYLYSTGFTGNTRVDCVTSSGRRNSLTYQSLAFRAGRHQILSKIYRQIMSPGSGRLFVHCWNGMHAAGEVAAIALRQFCGYSAEKAVSYWKSTQRDDPEKYRGVWAREIPRFTPYKDLQISSSLQSQVCP